MWFKTKFNEQYFLSDSVSQRSEAPMPPPPISKCPTRDIRPTDKHVDYLQWTHLNGNKSQFKYFIPEVVAEIQKPADMTQYPDHPNFINMKTFMSKMPTGPGGVVAISDSLMLTQDVSGVTLSLEGNYLLRWTPAGSTFFVGAGSESDTKLEHFKKYADKRLEYRHSKDYNLWEVKSPKSNWSPIFHNILFNEELVIMNQNVGEILFAQYKRSVKTIDDYLEHVSLKTICDAAGDAPELSVVASRCYGCHSHYKNHFKVHMQRRELPFYLIYTAIGEFTDDDPLSATWKLITACRKGDLEAANQFKSTLEFFLEKVTVITPLITSLPSSGHYSSNWQYGGKFWKGKHGLTVDAHGLGNNPLLVSEAAGNFAWTNTTLTISQPMPTAQQVEVFAEEEAQLETALAAAFDNEADTDAET